MGTAYVIQGLRKGFLCLLAAFECANVVFLDEVMNEVVAHLDKVAQVGFGPVEVILGQDDLHPDSD